MRIPEPVALEHRELHAELSQITRLGDAVGQAAREVARLLHAHVVREEQIALPPLGLLRAAAEGHLGTEASTAIALTDALRAEMPRMLEEHHQIKDALDALLKVARERGRSDCVRFAEKLMVHARMEEEVLYPAALLLGAYLKATEGRPRP